MPTALYLPEEGERGCKLLECEGFGLLNDAAPYRGGGRGTLSMAFPLVALI